MGCVTFNFAASPFLEPAIAADSINPGVTAKRNPRDRCDIIKVREAADSTFMCRIGYRPLRGLCKFFGSTDPGVPLRYTPGFTLSPASAG